MRDGGRDGIGIDDPTGLSLQLLIQRVDDGAQKGEARLLGLFRLGLEVDPAQVQRAAQYAQDGL
jgi:hypothetical protein